MKPFVGILILLLLFLISGNLESQTPDGYVVAGWTKSYVHGGMYDTDFLIYRLGVSGGKRWRKNYGSEMLDAGYSVCPSESGGFAVVGFTYSPDYDMRLYHLNGEGQKLWRKNYGGSGSDSGASICRTIDGGFIIGGNTTSYTNGGLDFLVYKLDGEGRKQWRKNYGGENWEKFSTVIQTSDGGHLLLGESATYTHGQWDFIVYKIDASGRKQWRKNYGGIAPDATQIVIKENHSGQVVQTRDGGYIFCGASESYTSGGTDFIVYKVDASGAKLWRKNYGGLFDDEATSIQQTTDGGYIVAGLSGTYTHGTPGTDLDFLIYKVDASGNKQWRKFYGGMYQDAGLSIQQTADRGYIFAGWSQSYVNGTPGVDIDVLVYKLDANGVKQWRKNFGGSEYDKGYSILEVFK